MRPGPLIRRLFGPYEHWAAEVFRGMFVNLDDFADLMKIWVPNAQRILEVGCGEGAMTERITRRYPNASVTAIDITPRLGRLYRGDTSNVTFTQEYVEDVARREPASFDLIVLADVLHHVPVDARPSLMNAIDQTIAPGGSFVFKEWAISSSPIDWICRGSDQYLSGDELSHLTPNGVEAFLTDTFGADAIRRIETVPPWKNNLVALVQRSAQSPAKDDRE